MKTLFKSSVSLLLCFSLASCSLFGWNKQTVKVVSNDPQAQIYCNGEFIGTGSAITKLKKNKSHAVTAKKGTKTGVAVIDSSMSATGVLDIVGGCIFLLPFLGFISPGAWSLDDTVTVNVQ